MTETSIVPTEPRTAHDLAVAISGGAPMTDTTWAIAETHALSLRSRDAAALGRPCATCAHVLHPRGRSPRCGHPLVAARLYDTTSGRLVTADVSTYDQREQYRHKYGGDLGQTACSYDGRLHQNARLPPVIRRIAAHLRARRMNLQH